MSKKPEAPKPATPPEDRELTSRDLETVAGGVMRNADDGGTKTSTTSSWDMTNSGKENQDQG